MEKSTNSIKERILAIHSPIQITCHQDSQWFMEQVVQLMENKLFRYATWIAATAAGNQVRDFVQVTPPFLPSFLLPSFDV
jgi:hypothetical protein